MNICYKLKIGSEYILGHVSKFQDNNKIDNFNGKLFEYCKIRFSDFVI